MEGRLTRQPHNVPSRFHSITFVIDDETAIGVHDEDAIRTGEVCILTKPGAGRPYFVLFATQDGSKNTRVGGEHGESRGIVRQIAKKPRNMHIEPIAKTLFQTADKLLLRNPTDDNNARDNQSANRQECYQGPLSALSQQRDPLITVQLHDVLRLSMTPGLSPPKLLSQTDVL
jgi:hypothetical protein